MKSKYDATIKAAFGADRSFVNALHQAFENFVNLNTRSPEYISLYVDDKLRRVGPDRYYSQCHRMPFNSGDEGSKCVRSRGGQWAW